MLLVLAVSIVTFVACWCWRKRRKDGSAGLTPGLPRGFGSAASALLLTISVLALGHLSLTWDRPPSPWLCREVPGDGLSPVPALCPKPVAAPEASPHGVSGTIWVVVNVSSIQRRIKTQKLQTAKGCLSPSALLALSASQGLNPPSMGAANAHPLL